MILEVWAKAVPDAAASPLASTKDGATAFPRADGASGGEADMAAERRLTAAHLPGLGKTCRGIFLSRAA